jgi:hypothetical protein
LWPEPPEAFIGAPLAPVCNFTPEFQAFVPLKAIHRPEIDQTAFVIHNLWGYSFHIAVCESPNCGMKQLDTTITYNFEFGEELINDEVFSLDVLDGEIVNGRRVAVSCPNRTIATDELGIGRACSEVGGYWAEIDQMLEYREIGDVNYAALGSEGEVWLRFDNLIAIPRDYGVEAPQLYWVSWSEPNTLGLVMSGSVFVGIGSVIFSFLSACRYLESH